MIASGPKDKIDSWIIDLAPGCSFVDIGGIGVSAANERTTIAQKSGATACAMADIRPFSFWEWENYRNIVRAKGAAASAEFDGVDVRKRETLSSMGRFDIVHSTGILYHVQSPPDALWNLRSITNKYLITNTVCFPRRVANEFGEMELPDAAILFGAALRPQDRRVLDKYFRDKFGWGIDAASPALGDQGTTCPWIDQGELTCWPYWWFYSEHAFKAMLTLCRLELIDEWWYEDHALQVLCRPVPD